MVELKGLGAELPFLKGTLEKLDIDVEVIRAGKYKSAAEPLLYDKMSKENREQVQRYIDQIWAKMSDDIALSRNMTVEELNGIADRLDALNAEMAKKLLIVDDLMYLDEMSSELKRMAEIDPDDNLKLVKIENYVDANFPKKDKKFVRDRIAVVYAIGSIMGGEGDDMTIGSDRISKAIRKARKDENVKAIVMRVNSPGGSAIASEVIRREIELASDVKPVIVSMGDVAASGGYWISCTADKILADEMTLTGSIGVFGLIPNMQGFFNNKLGVTFDYANTNENSDFPPVSKPMTDYQIEVLEREIGDIYEDFLKLVAEGREMTRDGVHEIAQGRVWAAKDAFDNNLVDEIGGMNRALELAAELAKLEDYRVIELPAQKDPFQELIEEISGNVKMRLIRNELGNNYHIYQYLKEVQEMEGIQARMPFNIKVK
jgi:protease-4